MKYHEIKYHSLYLVELILVVAWLIFGGWGISVIEEHFPVINNLPVPAIVESILFIFLMVILMGPLYVYCWIFIFDSEHDSTFFFSFKALFSTLRFIAPFILIYVVVPLVLLSYIGGWVFLLFPTWALGNFFVDWNLAKKREHMPMLEHTEAIGIFISVFIPTILSFVGLLIYYIFWQL